MIHTAMMSSGEEDELFRDAMKDVTRLSQGARRAVRSPLAEAPVRVAPSPAFTVSGTEGRAHGVSRSQLKALQQGQPPIDERIDLHGMRSEGARSVIASRVRAARAAGKRCLLFIHGRGRHSPAAPVLRDLLVAELVRAPLHHWVRAFCPASPAEGGAGATLVLLARERPGR